MTRPGWSDSADTEPQQAVELPLSPAQSARATAQLASVLLVRCVVAGLAAVGLLVAAVLLFRHGMQPGTFPPYATGTSSTVITRYSAPWIAGSAGAALLAGLAAVSFVVDLARRIQLRAPGRPR